MHVLPGLKQDQEVTGCCSTQSRPWGPKVIVQSLCQILHAALSHNKGLTQTTNHQSAWCLGHQVGTRAPSQTVQEKAMGTQEDAVQFRWKVDFLLHLRAAEPLQVLLGGRGGETDKRKLLNLKWPSHSFRLKTALRTQWIKQHPSVIDRAR